MSTNQLTAAALVAASYANQAAAQSIESTEGTNDAFENLPGWVLATVAGGALAIVCLALCCGRNADAKPVPHDEAPLTSPTKPSASDEDGSRSSYASDAVVVNLEAFARAE